MDLYGHPIWNSRAWIGSLKRLKKTGIVLSFGQVHVKHKQPQVLSLDSHVTIGMIQQT